MNKISALKKGLYYGFFGPLVGSTPFILWIVVAMLFESGDDMLKKAQAMFALLIVVPLVAYVLAGIPAFLTGLSAYFIGEEDTYKIAFVGGGLSFLSSLTIVGYDAGSGYIFAFIGAISAAILAKINVKRSAERL